ncbi:hypothetical protein HK096_011306, partial [Nowakowskiella sp. JEL0078]
MKPNSIAARRSAKSRDIQRLCVSTPFPQAALTSSPRTQLPLLNSPIQQHSPISAKSNSERLSAQICISASFSHQLTSVLCESESNEDIFYNSGPAMILPNLFLGSEQVVADKECIARNEIQYVLNVAKEINNPFNDQQTEINKILFSTAMESSPVSISSDTEAPTPELSMTSISNQSQFSSYLIPSTQRAISPISPNDFDYDRLRKTFQAPTYMKLNWSHDHDHVLDDFEAAFAYIDSARQSNASVLVACQQGISRSASLVIAYVMKTLSISLAEAYAFVKIRSPHISPNVGLIGQLA